MHPVPSAEKQATSAKRGKTGNQCQARENTQPVPSTGKHATGVKRGKTRTRCQVRENIQVNWCYVRENMQPVPRINGKTYNRFHARENKRAVPSAENMQPVRSVQPKRGNATGSKLEQTVFLLIGWARRMFVLTLKRKVGAGPERVRKLGGV